MSNPSPSDHAIVLKNIHKSFRKGRDQVLKGISIQFPVGKLSYILGPSGTGKSVTLKHILGLLSPDQGEVWVLGKKLSELNHDQLTDLRQKFGMVFQYAALFDDLTIFDNVAFPLYEHTKMKHEDVKREVEHTLKLLGM